MNELSEYEGFWWLPEHPEKQVAGKLIPYDDSAKLVLTIDTGDHPPVRSAKIRDYEVLYGKTSNGRHVSLLKCFDLNNSWSGIGIETREIFVNYVLDGALIPEDRIDTAFSGFSLTWPSLQRWFFSSGTSVEFDETNFRSFSIEYKPKDPIVFPYKEGVEIEFGFGADRLPTGGPLSTHVHYKEIVWVSIRCEQANSLLYFLEILDELIQLFSIFVLEYNRPEKISFFGNFGKNTLDDGTVVSPDMRLYHSTPQTPKSEDLPHPIDVLVTYESVEEAFENIVQTWGLSARNISPSRSLYFSSIYGKTRYVESTFLALAQSVEVLHRRVYGGTYIDPSKYEDEIRPLLESGIPDELHRDLKQVFKQRLEFFNEYSLSKRLKEICANHSEVLDAFYPNWKKMIRSVVQARNYYTHYTEKDDQGKPDINRLVEYRGFLKMLLELEILLYSGIEKDQLRKLAFECGKYNRLI